MTAANKIDALISRLESRLKKLKALRDVIDDDDIAEELTEIFSQNGVKPRKRVRRKLRNIDKLREFFNSRENKLATLAEIIQASGMSKHSLRQLLYRSNVGEFTRKSPSKGNRESRFRLKEKTT